MKGNIVLESSPGVGTSFIVEQIVNICMSKDVGNNATSMESFNHGGSNNLVLVEKRILLAMKYNFNLKNATEMLQGMKCEVFGVMTVKALLDLYKKCPSGYFSAVFVDDRIGD
jgi:hypothetical protein